MSKGDFPALRMVVGNGRLVPATQFDQERINSYRRGAIVMCKLNEEKDRVLVRKWFAILTLVVKQCQTPWKTKEEASEAIKLALGIVNLSKTVGGAFMQYPKSLTELDDPEMTDALEQMIALLGHMTGVDVETLKKEAADVGREIEHQDSNSATEALSPSGPSPDNDEHLPGSSQEDGGEVSPQPASSPSSSISADLTDADRALFMECAAKLFRITVQDDLDGPAKRRVLEGAKNNWKIKIRAEHHQKLASIFLSADSIITGKNKDRAGAIREVAGWLECVPSEIGGAA
ncbi:MAG: hypothetical protein WA950_12280 [Shinella sp.]|uniref:hypothetical protein n=1 Tax=Shinella sp. TaxID=1870904 RepID=UPI003C74072E